MIRAQLNIGDHVKAFIKGAVATSTCLGAPWNSISIRTAGMALALATREEPARAGFRNSCCGWKSTGC
jgi:hypothetical protein